MTLNVMQPFARNGVMPSWWANAIQRALTNYASLRILKANATTVQITAGTGESAAIVVIDGRWRWRESVVSLAHPGGAAGTFTLWATAKANAIVDSPQPGTDNTDYSFNLAFTTGGNPTVVPGTVDIFTRLALVKWDGSKITAIAPQRQGIGAIDTTLTPVSHATTPISLDADDLTLHELADYVAQLETTIRYFLRGGVFL